MAKTVAMSARDRGVDIGDPAALAAFLDDVQEGRVVLDEDLLGRVLERQLGRPAPGQERKFAQLPVSLPAPEELTAAAGRSKVARAVACLRGLAWPEGPGAHVGREHQARGCPGADRAARDRR